MMIMRESRWNNDDYFVPLKQQSAVRHIVLPGHIILIPSQPVFALSP
jgi:hypothetical protein